MPAAVVSEEVCGFRCATKAELRKEDHKSVLPSCRCVFQYRPRQVNVASDRDLGDCCGGIEWQNVQSSRMRTESPDNGWTATERGGLGTADGGRRVNGDDRRDHGGLTHLKRRREAWIHGAGCFQVPGVAVRQQINYRFQPQ